MKIALITLSKEGAILAGRLARSFSDAHIYLHENVDGSWSGQRFSSIKDLTAHIFRKYQGLVFIAPCGVAVRAIAPHLSNKTLDPAVVAVDVGGRWAVSLVGGHEGGANDLAVSVANLLFAEPVITTTSEALKDVFIGVGCRRGTKAESIVAAVKAALDEADLELAQVRLLSSVETKADEEGLLAAARDLGLPLRFISRDEILSSAREFQHSAFVEEWLHLPAVAEPAALLAGRRTKLVLPKKIHDGVTVAIARESCSW
jgi:cobalt-precorrin 5A hydrolase